MTDWGKTQLPKAEFLSIAEAAAQVKEWLQKDNITRLFVATNARKHELELYKSLVLGTVQCSAVHYSTVPYSAIQYSAVQHCTIHYRISRWCRLGYSKARYITILHCKSRWC